MQTSLEFLTEIEKFLEKHDISPTMFGKTLMGDPNFVFDLREGRILHMDTAAKIHRIINSPQSPNLFHRRPIEKHRR